MSTLTPERMAGFNSRSRVGSDRGVRLHNRRRLGFNSRSRVGSDSATARCGG